MISEQDIETLESHLDSQLTSSESAALQVRLAVDPELSEALQQLQASRHRRLEAWQSLEPSEAQVNAALDKLDASLARRSWFQSLVQQWPRLGVAAACIAMFATGMWMRDNLAGSDQVSGLRFSRPVSAPMGVSTNGRPVIEMRVMDPTGQPIDARGFLSIDEAEQYIGRLRLQRDLSTPR
jgi:anti-sigma factor RsiW